MTKKNPFAHLKGEGENLPATSKPFEVFDIQNVPKGFKAILIKKEFDSSVLDQIVTLENELSTLPVIKSDDDLSKVNGSLKKAKTLINKIGADRLEMASGLSQEQKALIELERKTIATLNTLVDTKNKAALAYQVEKDRRAKQAQEQIEKNRQEEMKRILAEKERVQIISNKIIQFEKNVLTAIASATYDDVDSKIEILNQTKLTAEVYQEFLPDAVDMLDRCKKLFTTRKEELQLLHELSLKNKEAADKLQKEQQAKIEANQAELESKKDSINEMLSDSHVSDVENIQMQTELRNAMVEKPSSVRRTYEADFTTIDMSLLPDEYKTFDEKKIKEAVKAGCREIPGVEIKEKLSNVSR